MAELPPVDQVSFQDIAHLSYLKVVSLVPDILPKHGPLMIWANNLFNTPSFHLLIEVVLAVLVLRLLFAPKYNPAKQRERLTKKEEEELLAEWVPEPLTPKVVAGNDGDGTVPVVEGVVGTHVTVAGKDYVNLASLNFLSLSGNGDLNKSAVKCIQKYGVGACGPRGFYGTIDVHVQLEERLAEFLRTEEAIIYSYGFSTIASAIPAYSKRADVLFVDEGISFATQRGVVASRSVVRRFKHNDMDDLERLLLEQQMQDTRDPSKAAVSRRFIVVEGLYANHGDICPLKQLVALKWKYKVRLIVEESMSFGVLGKTGRGVTEHCGVATKDVDIIAASMSNALGSIGGFCAGSTFVMDHQRLSGQGYCFSASLPPMLAAAAVTALDLIDRSPKLVASVQQNGALFHGALAAALAGCTTFRLEGDAKSPLLHVKLARSTDSLDEDRALLGRVEQAARADGVMLCRARYIHDEELYGAQPSIRLAVGADHSAAELKSAAATIGKACKAVKA